MEQENLESGITWFKCDIDAEEMYRQIQEWESYEHHYYFAIDGKDGRYVQAPFVGPDGYMAIGGAVGLDKDYIKFLLGGVDIDDVEKTEVGILVHVETTMKLRFKLKSKTKNKWNRT